MGEAAYFLLTLAHSVSVFPDRGMEETLPRERTCAESDIKEKFRKYISGHVKDSQFDPFIVISNNE